LRARLILGLVTSLAVLWLATHAELPRPGSSSLPAGGITETARPPATGCAPEGIANAYRNRERRVEVCGRGVVARVLREDDEGSRHQRFVVRLPSGQTVLIAYNIDIAPRIEDLRPNSTIEFAGEYEWNAQGGIVHWTHHDPSGRHAPGWIRYGGRAYQ
jgi:hypothetical protein